MQLHSKRVRTILLVVGVFCLVSTMSAGIRDAHGSQVARVYLTGNDLSTWRGNTGQWEIVGDVFMNPQNENLLSSKPGTGVLLNGPTGRTVNLLSQKEFGDVRAHIEFIIPKGSNSGVYFMGRYEIQIFDSWNKTSAYPGIECGGIYQRWDDSRKPKEKGYEGHSPRVNASRAPGQWQTFDVVFRAPRFDKGGLKVANARITVIHNGIVIHDNLELTGPTRAGEYGDEKTTGPLMLQGDHGPVAYRNIWMEPAGPNPFFAMDTATKDAKHQSAKDQVDMLKELGYDGIGIGYEGCEKLAEMLGQLDENGLRLFAVYLGVNLDAGEQKYDPTVKDAIQLLKGRNTILWVFVQSKKYQPSALKGDGRAEEIIGELAGVAADAEVRIALYPHYAFWLERVEDAVRVAKKVNRKNVGVTFNLCHWLRVDEEKNMLPLIESAMPYLYVVSINGADSGGKDWKQLIQTLDRGSFDMAGFLKALKDSGYTGPIGLQGYGIGGDAHENLKRSMNAWRRLSEELIAER